ncbi:MAG: sulfatase [Cyclobacteriaceae bacterium]|nr:MAG: sulfatase [Cyclobacteriaceae bacterium]
MKLDQHIHQINNHVNRRTFLYNGLFSLGGLALSSMAPSPTLSNVLAGNSAEFPHFAPKAKRIIYLFQSGAPSQMELFDYKPKLKSMFGQELPPSVRQGQRVTGMTSDQRSFPLAMGDFTFDQYGQNGTWLSNLLPYHREIADDICVIKTMYTEAINHDPAITFFQTGSQQAGRPSIGSWISYGLGSENANLPGFVVLLSRSKWNGGQPLYAKLWGNGFLPSEHQGVMFRSGHDPVLYLANPPGMDRQSRRRMLDYLAELNESQYQHTLDDNIQSRIAQYEMAYRMQVAVPETLDISNEPDYIFDLYGEDARKPGTYAYNCLLARKLAENDVRFIQLYHQGWDMHGGLPRLIKELTKDTDQASSALVLDLKQRGLLDDTLVVWGGEFGRGCYSQGKLTPENYGRDHHPRCFSIWMAGAGVKKGFTYGETDDFSYNIVKNPVHVHDLQATILHLMGIDHKRFTKKYQGRRFRLTDVHGEVVKDILT